MGSISREQLRLHFDFGRHGTAEDAGSLRRCIEKVKPSVLVLESAFLSEGDRKKEVSELNERLEDARRGYFRRRKLLEDMTRNAGIFEWPEFGKEAFNIIISSPGLRVHFIEESPAEEAIGDLFALPFMMGGPGQSLLALSEGDLAGAMEKAEKGFRDMNHFLIIERNRRMLEGFRRLGGELASLHPQAAASLPVSVLVRYGVAHAAVTHALRSEGFVVDSIAMPLLDTSTSLAIRYSSDTSMKFTREEVLGILYDYAYGAAYDGILPDQDEEARLSRALLHSLGGTEGFASLALSLSGQDADGFISSLRREFDARQKDIYSIPAL